MGEYEEIEKGLSRSNKGGSRRGGLFSGLANHVSSAMSEHLNPETQQRIVQAGKEAGARALDSTTDFVANNPDKVEKIGGIVGGAIGGAATGGFLGRKAGAKAGKKVGEVLSRKAKERKGSEPSQEAQSKPSNKPSRKDLYS